MRVQGATVPSEVWREAVTTVLWTDERSRESAPGLALPQAVAHAHGGDLSLRETQPGTVTPRTLETPSPPTGSRAF